MQDDLLHDENVAYSFYYIALLKFEIEGLLTMVFFSKYTVRMADRNAVLSTNTTIW